MWKAFYDTLTQWIKCYDYDYSFAMSLLLDTTHSPSRCCRCVSLWGRFNFSQTILRRRLAEKFPPTHARDPHTIKHNFCHSRHHVGTLGLFENYVIKFLSFLTKSFLLFFKIQDKTFDIFLLFMTHDITYERSPAELTRKQRIHHRLLEKWIS